MAIKGNVDGPVHHRAMLRASIAAIVIAAIGPAPGALSQEERAGTGAAARPEAGSGAVAGTGSAQDDQEVEIEVLEGGKGGDDTEVEVVDVGDGTQGGVDEPGVVSILGRFHPPVVHFAIAWGMLALPFALLRIRRPGTGRIDLVIVAISVLAAAAAVATGLLHESEVMSRPGVEPLIERHELAGFVTLGLLALALALRVVLEKRWIRGLAVIYAFLCALALLAAPLVGHLGGKITFGESFLPF